MRARGIIKIALASAGDFAILYYLIGIKWTVIVTVLIILLAWLGEYIDVLKDGGICINELGNYERDKLKRSFTMLSDNVKNKSGIHISNLKLHVIPSDDINAFAYGFRNMAVTRGMLNNCDEFTIDAVLAHEVSHILNLDAVFNRIVFLNITFMIFAMLAMSFIASSAVWVIFFILCILGICGGFASLFLFSGISKLIKGFFNLLQRGIVFMYKSLMALGSRGCEYRADRYATDLGYGMQLKYYLSRFASGDEQRKKSLSDIIYSTHPASHKRIYRIEQRTENYIKKV